MSLKEEGVSQTSSVDFEDAFRKIEVAKSYNELNPAEKEDFIMETEGMEQSSRVMGEMAMLCETAGYPKQSITPAIECMEQLIAIRQSVNLDIKQALCFPNFNRTVRDMELANQYEVEEQAEREVLYQRNKVVKAVEVVKD